MSTAGDLCVCVCMCVCVCVVLLPLLRLLLLDCDGSEPSLEREWELLETPARRCALPLDVHCVTVQQGWRAVER